MFKIIILSKEALEELKMIKPKPPFPLHKYKNKTRKQTLKERCKNG